jgi:hypothetical protein
MNVRDPFNLHRRPSSPLPSPTSTNSPTGPHAAAYPPLAFPGLPTPLDILRIRTTATQAAADIRTKAVEVGAQALEKGRQAVEELVNVANKEALPMSFSVPKNVPSFTNPQRTVEDHLWAVAASRSDAGAGGGSLTARAGHQHRPGAVLDDMSEKVGSFFNPNRNALPMYKDKPYAYTPSGRARPFYRRKRVLGSILLFVLLVIWWTGSFKEHHEKARASLSQWGWLKEPEAKAKGKADWLKRRERVVEAFELSWDAYERYAWGECATDSCPSSIHHPPWETAPAHRC